MRCPECSCVDDKVIDTRVSKEGESIRRRRECAKCGHRFTTYEMLMRAEAVVIKADGTRVEFDPAKLLNGIRMACWKRNVSPEQIEEAVRRITNRVAQLQQREVPTKVIGAMVMDELQKLDRVAYIRFASVYRRFEDAGQFIDEVQNLMHKNDTD